MTTTDTPPTTVPPATAAEPRYRETLQPVSGRALPVLKGETLRIVSPHGEQCVDFNAFNLHDYKEYMSVGSSRRQGLRLVEGDDLVTNSPRYRPILHISHMPATCVTDTMAARCNAVLFEKRFGFDWHTNCQDTLAEAVAEYRLTPDDVHDSFNIFMNTRWDDEGHFWSDWNPSRPGDHVDLVACMDTLAVPIICGSGDVTLVSNFWLKPVEIEVYPATAESLALVERVNEAAAAPASRVHPEQYKVKEILATRELTRDPDYVREYRRWPITHETLPVEVPDDVVAYAEAAVAAGKAVDVPDALRRAAMLEYLRSEALDPGVTRTAWGQTNPVVPR